MENAAETATATTATITQSKFSVPLGFGTIKIPSLILFGAVAAIIESVRNAIAHVKL